MATRGDKSEVRTLASYSPAVYSVSKSVFDVLAASVLLVILSPLLVAIAIAIRVTSRGPIVFRQERAGRNGVPFLLYKFRTMKTGVDPFGPSPKSGGDSRLTGLGKFLREYSLDELPQLANIVRGDMSFIGPRPLYTSQIPEWNERQRKRLVVRPGLTGLAQVSGRGRLVVEEKLELDVSYVEQAGFLLDCRILLATVAQLLGRKGIYERRYSNAECTRGEGMSGRNVDSQ